MVKSSSIFLLAETKFGWYNGRPTTLDQYEVLAIHPCKEFFCCEITLRKVNILVLSVLLFYFIVQVNQRRID